MLTPEDKAKLLKMAKVIVEQAQGIQDVIEDEDNQQPITYSNYDSISELLDIIYKKTVVFFSDITIFP